MVFLTFSQGAVLREDFSPGTKICSLSVTHTDVSKKGRVGMTHVRTSKSKKSKMVRFSYLIITIQYFSEILHLLACFFVFHRMYGRR